MTIQGSSGNGDYQDYSFQEYGDNWSNHKAGGDVQPVNMPAGVSGILGFGVMNANGTFDYPPGNYYFTARPQGYNTLAIGGWNNSNDPPPGSEQTEGWGGLKELIDNNQQDWPTAISNIVDVAKTQGYKSVCIDYENFNANKNKYTQFLTQLGSALHSQSPPINLDIAVSPYHLNYINAPALNGIVDNVELMTYDYALGQSQPLKLMPNASAQRTYDSIQLAEKAGFSADKLSVGIPYYSVAYQLSPPLSAEEFQKQINLPESQQSFGNSKLSYLNTAGPNQEPSYTITSDEERKQIGSWDNPNSPWVKLTGSESSGSTNVPNTWYYNTQTGVAYQGGDPQTINQYVGVGKAEGITSFFGYEAWGDRSGEMAEDTINAIKNQDPIVPSSSGGDSTYTVQAGDTLWNIFSKLGYSDIPEAINECVQLNNLANPNAIYPGEVLKLPPKN